MKIQYRIYNASYFVSTYFQISFAGKWGIELRFGKRYAGKNIIIGRVEPAITKKIIFHDKGQQRP